MYAAYTFLHSFTGAVLYKKLTDDPGPIYLYPALYGTLSNWYGSDSVPTLTSSLTGSMPFVEGAESKAHPFHFVTSDLLTIAFPGFSLTEGGTGGTFANSSWCCNATTITTNSPVVRSQRTSDGQTFDSSGEVWHYSTSSVSGLTFTRVAPYSATPPTTTVSWTSTGTYSRIRVTNGPFGWWTDGVDKYLIGHARATISWTSPVPHTATAHMAATEEYNDRPIYYFLERISGPRSVEYFNQYSNAPEEMKKRARCLWFSADLNKWVLSSARDSMSSTYGYWLSSVDGQDEPLTSMDIVYSGPLSLPPVVNVSRTSPSGFQLPPFVKLSDVDPVNIGAAT